MLDCCKPTPYRWLVPYAGFTAFTPVIPKLYFNVDSDEQRTLQLCKHLHKLICYIDHVADKVNIDHDAIEELQEEFKKFVESGFDDYYIDKIYKWIDANMASIISRAVKQVYFGLNDDGHFVAYIPDSWSDITFDTGMVYGRSDYGRLILRFEADSAIDNTYSYSNSQLRNAERAIADFESEINRIDAAFDTLFTNIDEEVVLNGNI